MKRLLSGTTFSASELQVTALVPLKCENLTEIYYVNDGFDYFVMDYVEAPTLQTLLEDDLAGVRENFIVIASGIIEALLALRKVGITHRDLKPANILIKDNWTPVVTDFGLAVVDGVPVAERQLAWRYLPAEAWEDGAVPDASWDVHSLGVIFYEIWTGRLPYLAETANALSLLIVRGQPKLPEAINPDISPEISKLTMLLIDRDNRPFTPIIAAQQLGRLNRGGEATERLPRLDDFQAYVLQLYGKANGRVSPVTMAAHIASNYNNAVRALRRDDATVFIVSMMHVLSWICAFADWLGFTPSEIVSVKYAQACPYCHLAPCSEECAGEESSAVRLRILSDYRSGSNRPIHAEWSLFQFQQHFRRLFGRRNSRAGMAAVASHGYEEVCEATEAALAANNLRAGEIANVHLEVADLFAWFFALLEYGPEDCDFESEFLNHYERCPDCNERPCIGKGQCPPRDRRSR